MLTRIISSVTKSVVFIVIVVSRWLSRTHHSKTRRRNAACLQWWSAMDCSDQKATGNLSVRGSHRRLAQRYSYTSLIWLFFSIQCYFSEYSIRMMEILCIVERKWLWTCVCAFLYSHRLKFILSNLSLFTVKVFCVDSRNHGDSPQCEEMSVKDMAADLVRFAKDNALPRLASRFNYK